MYEALLDVLPSDTFYLIFVGVTHTDKAGLIYTSAKRDKNCDLLRGYVKHLLYALDFDASPQLIEKDTIFVPAGWDSIEKIQIDFNSQNLTRDEGSFSCMLFLWL